MADFELEDSQGNRYRIRRGAGPQFWHTENLAGGSTLLADELLCNVPVSSIDAAHNHFYSDVLTSLPNRQSSPQGALSDALSSSHLTIEKIGTALVISDDVPDPRNELIVKIRNALATIVAGERAEAAMHTRLLDEENTLTKSMIYTGAFMQGIGSSAWGMVVWLKEVSDVVNPFVKMQHHAKALQAAWESEDFSKTYADTYVKGEKRELVEALGFDPTTITEQQIDEAMAMTSLVMDDPNVRGMLYQFTKDYAEAQHAIEVTNVIGSAVFEIILAIVMAAVTGGVGVVAAVGSKAHLIKKFQKVGDLLQDFAKATRSLKSQAKKRKTKGNQNAALPVEKVEAKKTDAHGAETGVVSTPNNSANATVPPQVPMSQEKFDEIINLENGNRPDDVGEYLPVEYVSEHLEKFKNEGAGMVIFEDWIANPKYKTLSPDGKFVGLGSEMDQLVIEFKASGGDWKVLRDGLNLGDEAMLEDSRIMYIKTNPGDPRFKFDIPTGNEGGAYQGEWVPGGYTKSGNSEATMSGGQHIAHDNNIDNLSKIENLHSERLK
jgi:hypothetical protein